MPGQSGVILDPNWKRWQPVVWRSQPPGVLQDRRRPTCWRAPRPAIIPVGRKPVTVPFVPFRLRSLPASRYRHTHRPNTILAASICPSGRAPARSATRRDAAFPGRITERAYPLRFVSCCLIPRRARTPHSRLASRAAPPQHRAVTCPGHGTKKEAHPRARQVTIQGERNARSGLQGR